MRLILASASPRRAELLSSAGFEFEIAPADVDETVHGNETPSAYALRVAQAKAEHIARHHQDATVLGADTVVVAAGRILGKPADEPDAADMLRQLSGITHDVLTAVVVCSGERSNHDLVRTRVLFRPLTDQEIAWYISSGEPFGKAGAYAIQGRAARFIDWIEGSWSNVVGLPIATVDRLLKTELTP
jgi:septum formation protein